METKNFMKNILLFATTLCLFSATSLYSACQYTVKPTSPKLKWTGYKMPAKVGVSGGFDKIMVKGFNKKAPSPEMALKGLMFEIASSSINSNDKGRDAKIYSILLGGQKGKITGNFVNAKSNQTIFNVKLNGKTVKVPMSYKVNGDKLKATGYVDLLDFALDSKLKAFTQACFAKHEGKTWSDVKIELDLGFDKKCS